MVEIEHGKRQTYVHGGCRCDPCAEANREYLRKYRAANKEKIRATQLRYTAKLKESNGIDIPHGTRSGYSDYGCRCDRCKEANTNYARRYRERRGQAKTALPAAQQ